MPKNALIKVQGTQQFMGKEIPVVLGGFGENQKVVTDKMVAEIHNTTPREIRKAINRNIVRFKESIDFIDLKKGGDEITTSDLKSSSSDDDLPFKLGYTKQQIIQAQNIYLLSERGYAKLIKIMDTDLAWEIHDQLMDEYFHLREEHKPLLEYNQELQELDKVAKIIGLSKQDKLVVVLSIMKRHNAPTLGLEELSICTQTKQIKNQQSVNDVIDYICDHNPVGFSIKEYYKNYLLHCAKNGLNPMDKVSLGKVIRQLGYESKCKRVDGTVGKVWFEIGGN